VSVKRRSYEAGHRPKFLVVVDETPECERALRFAARRVTRTGASLVLLGVVAPPDNFEWLGVGDAMRAEAEEEAQERLDTAAAAARSAAGVEPEQIVRLGDKSEAILELIQEDEDISFLVLAAGAGKAASTFPVPVVIVPGSLTDEEIDALAG
jgi:nucleotide-binding universal stress UspA family protein